MRKIIHSWAGVTVKIFSTVILCLVMVSSAFSVEDTAHLRFETKPFPVSSTHRYVVQKGDVMSAIIRRLPGVGNDNIREYYRQVRTLNPQMKNMQKIVPGQMIVLPGEGSSDQKERGLSDNQEIRNRVTSEKKAVLDGKSGAFSQTERLNTHTQRENAQRSSDGKDGRMKKMRISGNVSGETGSSMAKEQELGNYRVGSAFHRTDIMSEEKMLSVVGHVVSELGASFKATGTQDLINEDTRRITIDCAKIPMITFVNGMTVLLDREGEANEEFRSIFRRGAGNIHLVSLNSKDHYISVLKKIFTKTSIYQITKNTKWFAVGKKPDVSLMVDWMIYQKDKNNHLVPVQGLRILDQSDSCLPYAITDYARQTGFVITEIFREKGIAHSTAKNYFLMEAPEFSISSVKDFSFDFLAALGFQPMKNVKISLFDMARHGFAFSISADILVERDGRKYAVFCHPLQPHFLKALDASGYAAILLTDEDSPDSAMAKILRGVGMLFASGYFKFSGTEKGHVPFQLGFPGVKIKSERELYVVNFETAPVLVGLLHDWWSVSIARYERVKHTE